MRPAIRRRHGVTAQYAGSGKLANRRLQTFSLGSNVIAKAFVNHTGAWCEFNYKRSDKS